jgi:hypothetical protein
VEYLSHFFKEVLLVMLPLTLLCACTKNLPVGYQDLINKGDYARARIVIEKILTDDHSLTPGQKSDLSFEIERMSRIEKDFNESESDVRAYIKKYYPQMTEDDFSRWEREKSLEYMMINGEKRYFNRAARNLFRIDQHCRQIWVDYHQQRNLETEAEKMDVKKHNAEIIQTVLKSGKRYVLPVRMRIHYSISVKANMVPQGEVIRCWIPYPREIAQRQEKIDLIASDPPAHQIAPNQNLQRTMYLEKPSAGDQETKFSVQYEYTGYGSYMAIDPEKVQPVDPDGELAPYLKEEPPHIVFTEAFKKLSEDILKRETNPYRKAQILFKWVHDHTPWASAREYSTIRSLSRYGFENKHGDCGIQGLLFITLCRLNGIPARWQSGWNFKPPSDTMHDWGMIYFEPYGWMPMDAYYGPLESEQEDLRWFYLSGMDSYRLIFNDGYGQPFSPAKTYFRSETLDSQRGEVEWKGGNLYFDQWQWDMDWEVLSPTG